jgi:intracellular septation protein
MTHAAVLHLLTEFSPVLAFFVTGRFYDFYTASAVLLIFTSISLVISWIIERRIALMPLIAGTFVIIPGGFTLYFSNPDVLIFGDTLFYFLMASAVGLSMCFNRYILKDIFEATFAIKDAGWYILSYRWMILFILAGSGNEIVRIFFSPEAWVDYKFVKVIVIILFSLYQFKIAKEYRIEGQSNRWGLRTNLIIKAKEDTETLSQTKP